MKIDLKFHFCPKFWPNMSSYDSYLSNDTKKPVFDTGKCLSLFELTFWHSNWFIRVKTLLAKNSNKQSRIKVQPLIANVI